MPTITTTDGTEIFYKDWGSGQPIVFSHGWPLSADDWDAQLMFFLLHGYRVVAHDRRGHGRSTQVADGHDMDHYADDLAAVVAHLDLRDAIHVGHSTGGGEVVRYIARHGESRVAKAVLISSVPPLMVQTEANPGGLPKSVFDDFQTQTATRRSSFYRDVAAGPFYGFNRPGAHPDEAVIQNWWRQGMTGGAKAHYDGIVAFSQTDFTEDLQARSPSRSWSCTAKTTRSCPTPTPGHCPPSSSRTARSRPTRASRTACPPPRRTRSTPTCSPSSSHDRRESPVAGFLDASGPSAAGRCAPSSAPVGRWCAAPGSAPGQWWLGSAKRIFPQLRAGKTFGPNGRGLRVPLDAKPATVRHDEFDFSSPAAQAPADPKPVAGRSIDSSDPARIVT